MKETSDIAPVKAYLGATRDSDSCGFRALREQFRPPINVRSTTTDVRHKTIVYEGYSGHAEQNRTMVTPFTAPLIALSHGCPLE